MAASNGLLFSSEIVYPGLEMIRKTLLVGLILLGALAVRAELRLVASEGSEEFSSFEVREGAVWGLSPTGGAKGLPLGVKWRLEGDLLANAEFARYSADYEIANAVVSAAAGRKEANTIATVFLHRTADWREQDLVGSIAILVWMRDGQPQWIEVEVSRVTNGPSWAHAAMFVRELAEGEKDGYPVLFVLKNGQFVAPKKEYSDVALNGLLAAGYLGSAKDFSTALRQTKSLDERSTETGLSLLGMIAKTGRLDLVKQLLDGGAIIDAGAYEEHTAFAAAATKGRVLVVEHLLRSATADEVKKMSRNLLPLLARKNQLETAMVLVEAGFRKDAYLVLQLALSLRDTRVAKQLLAIGVDGPLYGVEAEALIAAASTGDAKLLQGLVDVGMRVSTKGDQSTVLIAAVQSGDIGAVEVLLKAKAKTTTKDKHGFRAIEHAVALGDLQMVRLLQHYKAAPARLNKRPVRSSIVGRVHAETDVDRLPILINDEAPVGSRVVTGNVLIANTSLGRNFRLPALYFKRNGEARTVGHSSSNAGMERFPHTYSGPSIYGAVSVVVDRDGNIADIDVISYAGNFNRLLAFDHSSRDKQIAAVMAHRFAPGSLDGVPVATRVMLPLLVHDY